MSWCNYITIVVILVSSAEQNASRIFYTDLVKQGYVYIMANDRPTLYTGVTSDLIKRVWQHKNHVVGGFTAKYNLNKLIYWEALDSIELAIIREKQIKDMNRANKLEMIHKFNPNFEDLYSQILGKPE